MKQPRKIERSEDQVQVSISLSRQLFDALEQAAQEHTRGNRSKLIATVLTGVLRTEKMAEMVKQGQVQQPLTQTELVKLAFHMIARDDPNTANVLRKSQLFKNLGIQ